MARERLNTSIPQSAGPRSYSLEVVTLLAEIKKVFLKVQRGGGVTLHETAVLDHYGSEEMQRHARRKDNDRHWWDVRDEWIEAFGGVGGLSFLDAEGFRYYLPAYMSYWLRSGQEPNLLTFHLENPNRYGFDTLFSPTEKSTIAKFLDYVRIHFQENRHAKRALDNYWGRFLEVSNQRR